MYVTGKERLIEPKSSKFGTTIGWCIGLLDEAAFGPRDFQAVTMAYSTEKRSALPNWRPHCACLLTKLCALQSGTRMSLA
jgi:hypothetical protein